MARVAAKIDCESCGTTGYQNPYRMTSITGFYRPGVSKRWMLTQGQLDFGGQASLKVDVAHRDLLNRATHIAFNGVQWRFLMSRDPGAAMGQERIVLIVNRKEP